MSQALASPEHDVDERPARANLPAITAPRLPYHPALEERFGVDINQWRALVDAVFPLAKDPSSIILALSYCRARNLDPFKKPVHIVPMWNSALKRMVETVWPGIGELRTTAFRTKQFAGRDEASYGPDIKEKVGNVELTYPEWCQVTVFRFLHGQRLPFPGPRVYWRESYATAGRDDQSPNAMWKRRPRGQLDKCAEAAALRAAFPEEIGNELTAEEMEGRTIDGGRSAPEPRKTIAQRLHEGRAPIDATTGEILEHEAADVPVEHDVVDQEAGGEEEDTPRGQLIDRLRGRAMSGGGALRLALKRLSDDEKALLTDEDTASLERAAASVDAQGREG